MNNQPKEDYLAAIYRQQQRDGKVTTSEVARSLGVTPASTTSMFKRLASDGLVDYKEYEGVSLAPEGEKAAAHLIRRHRLTERFLSDILGFAWDQVHDLADKMEHALPDEVLDKIETMLGDPDRCPHGHPIPRRDGSVDEVRERGLDHLANGEVGVISSVDEGDAALLRYLASVRLVPGEKVKVISRNPVDETMRLSVRGAELVVGPRISRAVTVAAAG